MINKHYHYVKRLLQLLYQVSAQLYMRRIPNINYDQCESVHMSEIKPKRKNKSLHLISIYKTSQHTILKKCVI